MDQTTDIADLLIDAGILIEIDSIDDLALSEDFRNEWRRCIDYLRDHKQASYLAQFFEIDPEALSIETTPDGTVLVHQDCKRVSEWPSKVAIDADLAAFITLQDWLPEWPELTGSQRDELVARLRVFLENCPACDGTLDTESSANDDIPDIVCSECGAALI